MRRKLSSARVVLFACAVVACFLVVVPASPVGAASNLWAEAPSPNVANTWNALNSVSCVSSAFCVAVGTTRDLTTSPETDSTLIEMWDGSSWSITPSPNPTNPFDPNHRIHDSLTSVSCVSATFCMAVGNGPALNIDAQWNGTNWTGGTFDLLGEDSFSGVSCATTTFCFAVGTSGSPIEANAHGLMERWNGGPWSTVSNSLVGASDWFNAVSCSSENDCMAVGGFIDTTSYSDVHTLVRHWHWTSPGVSTVTSPDGDTDNFLQGIWCVSESSCVAVGYDATTTFGTPTPLIESYDGTGWSLNTAPQPTTQRVLDGVSCISATDCIAVGQYVTGGQAIGFGQTFVDSWDGVTWSTSDAPQPNRLGALYGVSCTDTATCTAVGLALDDVGNQNTSILAGSQGPVPDTPTNVVAVAGFRSASVSWTPPADNGNPITTYTVSAWPDGATVTVPAADTSATVDGLADGTSYVIAVAATNSIGTSALGASNAVVPPLDTVSIADASVIEGNSGARNLIFPVTLSRPATTTVSVHYTVTDGTATGSTRRVSTTDYKAKTGTLTFKTSAATGITPSKLAASILVYADTAAESDETLTVTLSNVTGSDYQLGRAVATGTILNDDGITSGTTLGIGDASVVRTATGTTNLRFSVNLSAPTTSSVSVQYTITPGTATYGKKLSWGDDYGGATSGTLTFAAGTIGRPIMVTAWPDANADENENFTITLSNVNKPNVTLIRANATGTILDH